MAVLLNYFILCVWQYHLVRSNVNLPFTSMSYKASPIKLKLSFSTDDSVESKMSNELEDLNINPLKTSLSTQDKELSSNKVSVSKLLSKLGLISDNDSALKDFNDLKQKQTVDQNIYEVAPLTRNKIPNLISNINDKSDVPKDVQNKKNTGNYNINVISPPTVFSNFPISWPVTQNIAYSKRLAERNRYPKNLPTTPLRSYSVKIPTEEGKQESTTAWQNVRRTFSNNDEAGYNLLQPLIQNNPINIAKHDIHNIQNILKNEDTIVTSKDNAKFTYDLDINKPSFIINTQVDNLFDDNNHQIPIKILDTSYNIKNHNILPIVSDVINSHREITPEVSTLNKKNAESNKINDNMNSFNNIKEKLIPKCMSMKNIPSINTLFYDSNQSYISDKSPLPKSSPFPVPEISGPQPICTNDFYSYNSHLSLDNIISFLMSKFIFESSDISAKKSMRIPATLVASELVQPDITTDGAAKLSEMPVSFPIYDSSYPNVEPLTYLPKPNVDIPVKYTDGSTKKTITKSSVPYISSVTINYMPHIESSDDIIIFV